jgi:cyanophycin synthetase
MLTRDGNALPLVGIAGSRGKTTVAWLLHDMLQASRVSVGSWLSSGVYVDGLRQPGELHPWQRVLLAARHGELDVALQELPAAMVVGAGLPPRTYPLAILTTICGYDQERIHTPDAELVHRAARTVAEAVRENGWLVVNADDPAVVEIAAGSPANVVYFALHPDNPVLRDHLKSGGFGVWVEDGFVVSGTSEDASEIVSVTSIGPTLGGVFSHQIQNALAASASALVLGVHQNVAAATLEIFEISPSRQPGAGNIFWHGSAPIVVEELRDPWTARLVMRGLRHFSARRINLVCGNFEGLEIDELRDLGRALGSLRGFILQHSGRESPGQQEALWAGLRESGVPPIVAYFPSESDALDRLLATMGPDDISLVLTSDPRFAIEKLSQVVAG